MQVGGYRWITNQREHVRNYKDVNNFLENQKKDNQIKFTTNSLKLLSSNGTINPSF